jgi:hydroxypyruvate reductase
VLKHLCRVKGGQLARACEPAQLVSLLISDVVGDPLDTIASGPTAPDDSTFERCLEVVDFYHIGDKLPERAMNVLREGSAGKRPETPKPDSSCFRRGTIFIAANNAVAVDACVEKATELGFNSLALSSYMEGEATELAKAYVGIAREIKHNNRPVKMPAAIIGGGETTVTLPAAGGGIGGRSQALALSGLRLIDGMSGTAILAGGTDGGDGPCDAGGAVVCGSDASEARRLGFKVADFLQRADSYSFYKAFEQQKYGRQNVMHLRDGPTGTNVMDLVITLVV